MHDTHRRTNFVKYECLRTMQCYTQTGRQAHHFFAQRTHALKHTRVNERVKQDAQASVVKQGVRAHTPASTDACAHTRVRTNAHMRIDMYAHPQPLREPCCALANNMKTQRRTRKYTYARLHSHTHTDAQPHVSLHAQTPRTSARRKCGCMKTKRYNLLTSVASAKDAIGQTN